ncbi:hypothetical protein ACPV36_12390 [Photobacterium damselae]|uniref:hypothetical protein n=1 Tax=Photobacterium damselae TaxID=38293 RepID=UPI0040685CE0
MLSIKQLAIILLLLNSAPIWATTEIGNGAINLELEIPSPTCNITGLGVINMKEVVVGGHSDIGILQLGVNCSTATIQSHLSAWASNISADKKIMYLDADKKISFQIKEQSTLQNVLFDGSQPLCSGRDDRNCVYNTYLTVAPTANIGDYSNIVTFKLYYN